METLEKVIAKITVNGKNVTADVSPYLSRLSYADKEEAESDDLTLTFEDTTDHWKNGWYPEQGDTLEVSIGTPDAPLDCGLFEIDEIGLEFPPDTVAIKAIGAAISKALRSKNSKAFEKQSLKQIAQYFATKHGLKLVGNVSDLQKDRSRAQDAGEADRPRIFKQAGQRVRDRIFRSWRSTCVYGHRGTGVSARGDDHSQKRIEPGVVH